MRSSKSRSRSKSNRPRTMGNIVNRVFDSSGPEGKVRGTPQQIIEKYLFLARDAQLSNDRVAAENFLQHAEHYTRMLGEAQRELAAEQEARQQQHGGNGTGGTQQNGNGNGQGGYRDRNDRGDYRPEPREDRDPGQSDQPYLREDSSFAPRDEDSGLVETPEMKAPVAAPRHERSDRAQEPRAEGEAKPKGERREHRGNGERRNNERNERRPRPAETTEAPRVAPEPAAAAPQPAPAPQPAVIEAPATVETTPAVAPKPKKAPAPRKPKVEKPKSETPGSDADGKTEAAE